MRKRLISLICSALIITQVFPANGFSKEPPAQYVVCPTCTKINRIPPTPNIEKITCAECKADLNLIDLAYVSYKEASELKYKIYKERERRADEKGFPDVITICCPRCKDKTHLSRYQILNILEGRKDRVIKCSISSCGYSYDIVEGAEAYNTYKIKQKSENAVILGCLAIGVLGGLAATSSSGNKKSYRYPYLNTASYAPNTYTTSTPATYSTATIAPSRTFLGRLSANQYAHDSTSNPYGPYGSPYSSTSVNNPYGRYGSQVNNPYSFNAPKIYASDGTYLGKLSSNQYDSESISNPYGRYGSLYSSTSINNPYSQYGSRYSSQSPNNPYSSDGPVIIGE